MDKRASYQSDLTDEQWAVIEPLLPERTSQRGRPRKYSHREMFNALLYLIKNGCTWRDLPHDFPKWQAVYAYMRRMEAAGTLRRINDALREMERVRQGRNPGPSTVVIDTQSVRTAEKRGRCTAMTATSASRDANASLP
jgi:transposase